MNALPANQYPPVPAVTEPKAETIDQLVATEREVQKLMDLLNQGQRHDYLDVADVEDVQRALRMLRRRWALHGYLPKEAAASH